MKTVECEQLAIGTESYDALSVDQEQKVIKGFVVAQAGQFRTAGRGEFDERSLRQIKRLMLSDPEGLRSYFGHAKPGDSVHQLGRLLGRAKSPRIEEISVIRNGERQKVQAVLADLHLSPTAFDGNPNGNIGGYVMNLAATDPKAFGSSLVLDAAKEHRLHRGRAVMDDKGNPLPPLWRPLELSSIDVVGNGEAVDAFLPSRLSATQAMECLSADPEFQAQEESSDDGQTLEDYLLAVEIEEA